MKRRVLGALLLTLLIAATSILPSAFAQVPPGEDHVLAILTPPEVTFGSEALAWEIPLPILESSKEANQFKVELAEVKLGKEVVPASAQAVTSGTVSDLPIASVGGGVTPGELKSYVGLN
ncbi:MAG: hypothetical protein H5U02_15450, partial [Clostridia bacterium]|nr:hypothetical protein [Clostridia bacterium]